MTDKEWLISTIILTCIAFSGECNPDSDFCCSKVLHNSYLIRQSSCAVEFKGRDINFGEYHCTLL